jgi:branched-chain amino acid transport system ATP-binding protein
MTDAIPPVPDVGVGPGDVPAVLPPADSLLITDHLSKSFGGLHAVSEVTFWIPERGIVSIIGPNGAGKTTFFNMLTGLYRPTTGLIAYRGRDITGLRPDRIMALGVARTFQNIRLFGTMTALENVLVGEHSRMHAGLVGSILRLPRVRREEREVRDKAREVLQYVGLRPRVHGMLATNLSYGDQRRVEIARALASEPTLLLLDEPTAGMNADESARLVEFVRRLRDERDVAVLLIEHDMKVVMSLSERVTVLDHGEKVAEGEPSAVAANPRVVEDYLGKQGGVA